MTEIIAFIKAVAFCLPFVTVSLLSMKLNLKKEFRYRQVFYPVLALVYCIVAVIFLDSISNFVLNGIYFLCDKVSFLAFLKNVNWASWLTFIVNAVLVIGFLIIKSVLFPVVYALSKVPQLADKTSGAFYYKPKDDEEKAKKGIRYLKDKFGDARRIIKSIYIAMLVIFTLLLAVTHTLVSSELFSAPFYPVFGVLVWGEIVFFLSGITHEEKLVEEEVPVEEETKEINYDDLPEEYESLFPNRLIQADSEKATEQMQESVEELLNKYRKEYDETLNHEAHLMCRYYDAILANGDVLDEGYLSQTRNILDGKSVLFLTQFYDDTTPYVFLPVVRCLMKRRKILIVLGRNGGEQETAEWFRRGICSVNNLDGIWKIDKISNADEETSVAVLEAKDIYNLKMLNAKASFLSSASMVFILEPYYLLGTLQVGLGCLVSFLRRNGNDPQYIMYDRNCDGLVDSLSHVINKSIVQVNATSVGTAKKNLLFWKADGGLLHHKLGLSSSRYLGVGTELALVALRQGVSKVVWASSGKFPVVDMRWIASQYYAPLCRVAGLKISQNELSENMEFVNNTSSINKRNDSFIIAEDEYNNAFEVARQFATRGVEQSFVNVVSQNYWLRSYMTDNFEIFKHDAKAIPTITADYQRSVGNVLYKLIIRMIENPIEESEVRDALEIIGEDTSTIYNTLRELITRFFLNISGEKGDNIYANIDGIISVSTVTVVDPKTVRTERKRFYAINNRSFVDGFLAQLKIVYYIAEDENDRDHYIGSVMYGHIYQKYLPGMFATFDGKYYEIISVTKSNGVLIRRASDHILSRHYYRVLRSYNVALLDDKKTLGAEHTYGNIKFRRAEADICVDTFGYYDMQDYGNMKTAQKVLISNIEPRTYKRKSVILVELGDCTDSVRLTVAALLNELFVTAFPDTYQYITATTAFDGDAESISWLVPTLEGCSDNCIYIIEDSLTDLGLLSNVERYIIRFFEIICDSLAWHSEKLSAEGSGDEPGSAEPPTGGAGEDDGAEEGAGEGTGEGTGTDDGADTGKPKKKKKGLFGWLAGLFKRKKKAPKGEEPGVDEVPEPAAGEEYGEPEEPAQPEGEDLGEPDNTDNDTDNGDTPLGDKNIRFSKSCMPIRTLRDEIDVSGIEGDDSGAITIGEGGMLAQPEEEQEQPYSKSFYLLFGFEQVPKALDIDGAGKYLIDQGFGNNYLKQTRDSCKNSKLKWYNYHIEAGTHYCDFCGAPLEEKFDVLDDGRERCAECSRTAIVKLKDLKKLYKKTRKQMEEIFGIKLGKHIKIYMCNAQKIAEHFGESFTPTPGFDGRVLGFATNSKRSYDIQIENGSPLIETEKTLVHEMTHLWQYDNLPDLFVSGVPLEACEGMAVWAEAQYLLSIGLEERAMAYVECRLASNNEYGNGLRLYLERFPLNRGRRAGGKSPFACSKNPLQ